jgi:serpin B
MKKIAALLALLAALAPLPAAALPPPFARDPLANYNRDFTAALFRQVARESEGNVFLSPLSVTLALTPLVAGARGETRDEINDSLDLPRDWPQLHSVAGALQRALVRDGPNATIDIANALWPSRAFDLHAPFLENVRTHYGATVESLDFAGAPEQAAERINLWASTETRGRIPQVIAARDLDERTRLIVTNAVYFRADWLDPFPPSTRPDRFRLAGGGEIQVPMMAQSGRFRHWAGGGMAMLDLPYADERLVMTVLLPDEGADFAAFERSLGSAQLGRLLRTLDAAEPAYVSVKLPRLELRAEYALTQPLQRLGMHRAFAPGADFGGLADGPLWISGVRQLTYLRVDELGTEAAAVTLTEIVTTGARSRRPPIPFHADRPFLLILRDRESGAILFIGRILRPDQAD